MIQIETNKQTSDNASGLLSDIVYIQPAISSSFERLFFFNLKQLFVEIHVHEFI